MVTGSSVDCNPGSPESRSVFCLELRPVLAYDAFEMHGPHSFEYRGVVRQGSYLYDFYTLFMYYLRAMKSATDKRNERIWATICDIPEGSVASYGQIAEIAGIPRGARQVGYALRHLPKRSAVPWYRVIQASGTIAFPKGSDGFVEQTRRLAKEDVAILNGRIDMKKYRWQPDLDELLWKPNAAWDEE